MSKNKIEFIAETKEMLDILERPYPAIKKMPDWICNIPSYIGGIRSVDQHSEPNSTIKKCMPVIDSMTVGYHIPVHSDIWIENDGIFENINIKWAWHSLKIIDIQEKERMQTYPVPKEYYPIAFKFLNPWVIKTRKGWSCLFTHPMHHDDLPFRSLPAIVDTDKYPNGINFIFFLKKDFSGLIPKGTPIIQVIPFKRSLFKSEFSYDKGGFLKQQWEKASSEFFDVYKKFFRSPKKYEQGDVKKCPFHFLHK